MGNNISHADFDDPDYSVNENKINSHSHNRGVKGKLRRSLSGGSSPGSFFRRKSHDDILEVPDKQLEESTPTRSSSSLYSQNGGKVYADCLVKLTKNLVARSQKCHKVSGITSDSFTKFVCKGNELLGNALYSYFLLHQPGKRESSCLSKDAFLIGTQKILDLISESSQLEYYVRVFAYDESNVTRKTFLDLLQASFQFSQMCPNPELLSEENSEGFEAVEKSLFLNKSELSINYLIRWLEENCPRLVSWLHKSLVHQLTVGYRLVAEEDAMKPKSSTGMAHFAGDALDKLTAVPALISCKSQEGGASQSSPFSSAQLWLMACTLPSLYIQTIQSPSKDSSLALYRDPQAFINQLVSGGSLKHWEPLYDSDNQGLSLNRFLHHVFGYRGPTLLTLKGENDVSFAVAVDSEWKESNHYWGHINSKALQLTPHYKVLDGGANLLYLNTSVRGYPFGLKIGTDPKIPWLEVDKEFTLLSFRKVPYKLHRMQVWGCGSTQQKEALQQHKKWELQQVEKTRKVNLNSVEWDMNPDKYLLELGGERPQYSRQGNV